MDILFNSVINILNKNNESIGTGFFVSNKNIITCLHNIDKIYNHNELVSFKFTNKKDIFQARWNNTYSDKLDIVVLEIEANNSWSIINYLKIGTSIDCFGQLHTFGFPEGSKTAIHAKCTIYGIVSNDNGKVYIQLGEANEITKGFSGGPLLDEKNDVVGVVTHITKVSKNNRLTEVAFAIPIEFIQNEFLNVVFCIEEKLIELVGRKSEICFYKKELSKNKYICIYGIAGVGKSTVGRYICQELNEYNKFWYTFANQVNDEIEPLILQLAQFLAKLGNLQPVRIFNDIHRTYGDDYYIRMQTLVKIIIDDIKNRKVIICLDDLHIVKNKENIISFLKDMVKNLVNNKIIFMSRKMLDFVSNSSTPALGGLSKEDTKEFLQKAELNLKSNQVTKLYNKTQGNVKIIELLIASLKNTAPSKFDEILDNVYSDKSIFSYITNNIYENLTILEQNILKILAISRAPISLNVLVGILNVSIDDLFFALNNLVFNSIVEVQNGSYSMHALLKEYFSMLNAYDSLTYHYKLATNLSEQQILDISYHYSCCGMIKEALEILDKKMSLIINRGCLSILQNQISNYENLVHEQRDLILLEIIYCRIEECLGNYDKTINRLHKTIQMIQGIPIYEDNKMRYEILVLLSQCFEKKGEYRNALECINQAILYTDNNKINVAVISINKGFLLCHMEHIRRGIKICNKGLRKLEEEEADDRLIAAACSYLGWNYTVKGKYDRAIEYLTKSCKHFKEDYRGVCLSKIRLARVYWQKGNLKKALEEINIAVDLAKDIEDLQLKAFAIRQQNLIIWNMGQLVDALNGHIESEKIYRKINDKWGLAASLENKAAVLFDLRKMKESEECIDEAIQICKENDITDFLAYAYTYKSKILSHSNRTLEGIHYARKAILLLIKWRYSTYYLGMALIALGIAYLNRREYIRSFVVFSVAANKMSKGNVEYQEHIAKFYLMIIRQLKRGILFKTKKTELREEIYAYFKKESSLEITILLEKIEESYFDNDINYS